MKKSATTTNTRPAVKVNTNTKVANGSRQEKLTLGGRAYVRALDSRRSDGNNSKFLGNNSYRNTYYNSLGVISHKLLIMPMFRMTLASTTLMRTRCRPTPRPP
jgi:hypothetical protein